jgi:hypothetical protein
MDCHGRHIGLLLIGKPEENKLGKNNSGGIIVFR